MLCDSEIGSHSALPKITPVVYVTSTLTSASNAMGEGKPTACPKAYAC